VFKRRVSCDYKEIILSYKHYLKDQSEAGLKQNLNLYVLLCDNHKSLFMWLPHDVIVWGVG